MLITDAATSRAESNAEYYAVNSDKPVDPRDVDPNLLRPEAEATVDRDVAAAAAGAAKQLESAHSSATVARRNTNREQYAPRLAGPKSLDELALMVDPILLSITQDHGEDPGYAERAARNILQSGQTTAYAIALLLSHGYVIDAEARWRGIYELACSASVLAKSSDIEQVSARYLVHGRMLPEWDTGYRKPWATEDFYAQSYAWMRPDYPSGRLTQRRLLDEGALLGAPFKEWVYDSHQPVHMSSIAVADGSTLAGGAPPGYSAERAESIACRTAWSLNEIVATTALILGRASYEYEPHLLAWPTAFHAAVADRVRGLLTLGALLLHDESDRLNSALIVDD